MDAGWRAPYRSRDASGTPEAAEAVGWAWIEALAKEYVTAGACPADLSIESPSLGSDGRVIALYRGTRLLALAAIFRDAMNFAVLVRWRAEDGDHAAAASKWRARAGDLADALEPFAEAAADLDRDERDDWSIWEHPVAMNIQIGHLRKAAGVLVMPKGGE